jgi:hypothetical protein
MFCNRISNVPPNPSAHSNTDPARLGVCCAKLIAPVFVVDRDVAAAIAAVVASFAAMLLWCLFGGVPRKAEPLSPDMHADE